MPRKNSKGELAGSTDPDSHYTPLGRLKLTSKEPQNSLLRRKLKNTDNNIAQTDSAKKSGLFKSASVQRIRTRLGLHPELYKNPDNKELVITDQMSGTSIGKNNVNTENSQLVIKGCADFNKSTVIILVRKRFLSARYMQLAEECRIRQNAAYARIDRQVNGYGRDYLQRVAERARPFLFHVVDSLSKYNLPMDLALLPIVESAYQPTALSSAQAAGIWQFIPSTGREFGLQQTEEYDARLDVVAETHAAVRFLSGLRDHYRGDWLLALAAYNAGPGTVDAAISRNVAAGLGGDYWSLDLPAETQDYVPRLLALARIFSNPSTYGLKLRPVVNETYFIKVHIDHETDIKHLENKGLRTVAKLADFNPDQFSTLNSAYLKATLPEFKSFSLLMPISNANVLHQSLAFMAQSHKDEEKSALHFFEELALFSEPTWSKTQMPFLAINPNADQQWFSPARQLAEISIKPKSTANEAKIAKTTGEDYLPVHYLDKGESLKAVAENHGVSEEALREINKLKRRQTISLGQRLLIPHKQLAAVTTVKKTKVSVLFKGITGDFDPLL